MSENIIPFRSHEYTAKLFHAGAWQIAGTLCGNIDVATPNCTWNMSPDEVQVLIVALTNAREDVLQNSRPFDDPRLYDTGDRP